jgi:predicted phosphodiesterase
MKIIAIGDIHGRTNWKKVIEQETFDKIVFMGDYFDSYDYIDPQDQISNFQEIMDLKNSDPDKVVTIFGNHDYHYMRGVTEKYSGYQAVCRFDFEEALNQNRDNLQACFVYDKYIFTHAGITKNWFRTLEKWFVDNDIDTEDMSLEDKVNFAYQYNLDIFKFTPGRKFDHQGDEITQTPIWVRPDALMSNRLDGYFHVVGHTFGNPQILTDNLEGGVIKIDALGINYYLVINNDIGGNEMIPEIKRLKIK